MGARDDEGSWSRAYMASSGLALTTRGRGESADLSLASSASLSRQRVSALSQHRDAAVREAIARRDDCPFGVLAALAHDSRPLVRIAVAAHARAGRTVLAHLASDRDPHVVKAVARNLEAPREIVERLTRHRREEVRHLAERMLAERDAALLSGAAPADAGRGHVDGPHTVALHHVQANVEADAAHPMRRVAPATLAPRPAVGRTQARPSTTPAGQWAPASQAPAVGTS
ncbi:hypothetical protein [Demequina sp. NBRC 110055]|uniref:hypothetical protein n=1 Tax=Demequina sp. NBRC 110055 TaxID=1570344 RepID=UPI000A0227AD|nr:hypothetical protein [Demequina sp. NBRC 110055]